jgi:hypothetical protein
VSADTDVLDGWALEIVEINTKVWSENLKKTVHLDALGLNGMLILKWGGEIGLTDVDWIHLAQDMDQWRTLVKTVIKLRFYERRGNFLTS